MTDADWLVCTDVPAMLLHAGPRLGSRKMRLFGAACAERVWRLLTDARSRKAVKVALRLADGQCHERDRKAAYLAARAAVEEMEADARTPPEIDTTAAVAAAVAARECVGEQRSPSDLVALVAAAARAGRGAGLRGSFARRRRDLSTWSDLGETERAAQAILLRDMLGPREPPAVRPEWRTDAVGVVARAVYESRDFGAMGVLGDALEDAGCEDRVILDHCRSPAEHARGCWVVEMFRG